MAMITPERDLEESLVTKLRDLKYEYRPDIRDRAKLEANFREKFEALNRVNLTDGEFQRLLDEIVTPDVYEAARSLRNREAFIRDDGTPLNYTLVNIKDWCKNTFEVVNQLLALRLPCGTVDQTAGRFCAFRSASRSWHRSNNTIRVPSCSRGA